MLEEKGGEFTGLFRGEAGAPSVETGESDGGFSGAGRFCSNEIERLDEGILFPPVSTVELRGSMFQKSEDGEMGRAVVEYVDLGRIPASLMRRLSRFKPTEDVQVRMDGDSSDSWSDKPEEDLKFGPSLYDSELVDGPDEKDEDAEVSQSPTHFFSLAFNRHSSNLIKEYRALRKTVVESMEYGDIRPSYFIGEKKLHVTLGLVRAESPQELSLCESALLTLRESQEFRDIVEESSPEKGLLLGLCGLGYFGSPQHSRVVYAKISEMHKTILIKRLWSKLCEILVSYGLKINPQTLGRDQSLAEAVIQDYNPHVTLINTKYGSRREKQGQRTTFNSTKLVRTYSRKNFGPGYISEIQLNELSGTQELKMGTSQEQTTYKTISSLKISSS